MAYEIVKRLEELNQTELIIILKNGVTPKEYQRGKKHRIFEISSDIKVCYTEKFLLQKLEYIHSNPVSKKWQLASSAESYPHSSAAFYELNKKHSDVDISHYKELGRAVASSPAGDDA